MKLKKGITAFFILSVLLSCFAACKDAGKTAGQDGTAPTAFTGEQAAQLFNNLGQGLDVLIAAGEFEAESAADETIVAFAMTQQKASYARQLVQGTIDQNTFDMLTLQYFDYEIDAATNKYFGKKASSYSTQYSSFSGENDSLREKDWPFTGTTMVVTENLEEIAGLYTAKFLVYHFEDGEAPKAEALAGDTYASSQIGIIETKFHVYGAEEKYPVFSTFSFTKQ